MNEFQESKESHTKKKLLSMKKLFTPKEFLLKEPSLTIMLLRLKLSTFLKKLNKPSLNTSQSKELGKESNICQLRPKLCTTQREKNM